MKTDETDGYSQHEAYASSLRRYARYKQDSVTIHFTWKPDWPRVSQLLPVIENELAPFRARPHWGKLFTFPPARLHSLYEKSPEFVELCKKFDPQGKFRNEFLNMYIFRISNLN
jgi:xylitol oxidase